MNFCWSTLMVRDLEKSIEFYTEIIGLDVIEKVQAGPDTQIAFLGKGETKIELICSKGKENIEVGQDISWGFETESLDDTLSYVKDKGYKILTDPIQPNPTIKFFYLLDPNGFKIQIVQHIAPNK